MPKVVIKDGEKKGLVLRLKEEEITVGRDPSNMIVLPDRRVSRRHARIIVKGEKCTVEDLGSVNGTKVNTKPIKKQKLEYGDEITFGTTTVRFLTLDGSEDITAAFDASQVKILKENEDAAPQDVQVKVAAGDAPPFNQQAASSSDEELEKAYKRLMTLYRVSHELGSVVSLSQLLDDIMDLVLEIMDADRGFIMLKDNETGELGGLQGVKKRKGLEKDDIAISKTIINQVMSSGESILSSDALQDARFKEAQSIILHDVRSTMCVPIKVKDGIIGIMNVDTKGKVISFTKDDLELLTAISEQAGAAIQNARLFDDLKKANVELKEQQNQLIEAEKLSAVGQMASGVAHEINNPMTSIMGFSELTERVLTKKEPTEEVVKECIENMKLVQSEANRCQTIVQSLLQYSRRKEVEMSPTDINKLIETTLLIAKFQIKKSHLKIEQNLDPDLPEVKAVANEIQQVFLNMIINARDAMEDMKNGVITITTEKVGDRQVQITFADNGCGIPEDKLEEIFKPLYTSKEEGKGTGLGLSVTIDILEHHKGSIDVESTVGKGTSFIIRLPI